MSSKKEEAEMANGSEKPVKFESPKKHSEPKSDQVGFIHNVLSILSKIKEMKIELVLFMYMFAHIMTSVSLTSMIMDKVCLYYLNESEHVCSNLKNYTDTKSEVSKLANNYTVANSLLQMLPSSIIACFMGAWSDKYSRKVPLIMAFTGAAINGLGLTISAVFFEIRVEFLFITAFIAGISGGMVTVMTVVYSYASDITTFDKRTIKYAFMGFAFGMAMPLGQLTGGWLFQWFGYVPVFLVATCCHVFTFFFVSCVLQETKGLDNKDNWKVKFRNLWSFVPVMESIRATVKKRPNNGRLQILLLILAMSLAILSYASTGQINFIYCHHLYDWGNTKFSTISSLFSVIGTITMIISVPIFRRYKCEDPTLGIVGSCSLLLKNIGLGLAMKEDFYFLASLLGLLTGLATLAGRAKISKVVPKNDIGKVFAFVSTAESLLPVLSAVVASQIFNATLDFFPGFIYVLLGVLLIIPLAIFIWISRLPITQYAESHKEGAAKVPNDPSKSTEEPSKRTESTQSNGIKAENEIELQSKL